MPRGIFVTGTDTHVGKTVVSAALMRRYRGAVELRYWKPVQTGIEQDDDSADVARLAACGADGILSCGVRLPNPVSPHLAARLSGRTIAVQPLVDLLREADLKALDCARAGVRPAATRWIVEGAGGVLVPLNESRGPEGSAPHESEESAPHGELVVDLMVALAMPVLIVARSTLGTINHTLLTIEALRRRELRVAGVVMVGPPDDENRAAIERHGGASVIAAMPRFDRLTPDRLAAWASTDLDPYGRLLELLR